jgi:MSHA biogenesis protein MshP
MSTIRRRRADRGFALASAIFILVVLAALAVGITLLTTQAQTGLARDLLGSRAYQAARAGLDWGAYRVLDPLNTTATSGSAPLPNCPGAAGSICPAAAPLLQPCPTAPFASTAGRSTPSRCSAPHDHTEPADHPRVPVRRPPRPHGHERGRATGSPGASLPRSQRQPGNQPPYGCS